MSQTIRITLLKALAVNTVKNETFQKGLIDKAADQKNLSVAYHEAAGDDQFHERMLDRAFFTQCEMLKTWFAEYLTGSGNNVEDALVSSEENNEAVDILLNVSQRFNTGYVKTLARLAQKYVEDRMIHLWWANSDKEKSAYYATIAEENLDAIKQCFNKTAPSAPSYNFPDTITLQFPIIDQQAAGPAGSPAGYTVPDDTLLSDPYIIAVGEETEITYTLSCKSGNRPTDDILVRADNGCCRPYMDAQGQWHVRGLRNGITIVTLFSRHDDTVFTRFALRVRE